MENDQKCYFCKMNRAEMILSNKNLRKAIKNGLDLQQLAIFDNVMLQLFASHLGVNSQSETGRDLSQQSLKKGFLETNKDLPICKKCWKIVEPHLGSCFIATAACGTASAREVVILQEFRTVMLRNSNVGVRLINLYESISPPLAAFIRGKTVLKGIAYLFIVYPASLLARKIMAFCRN